jgi:glyceraldehyde-3-phosphate dehydrogenase (NADP+)
MAAGNPILHKPPSKTPLTATLLGDIILEAGWPPEAISVLPASGAMAERMLADERVKMLTFTGSAAVGWYLRKLAHKKKVTLELGGNGAVIVDRDSDWELAAERIKFGAFYYAGQACISVQRIFVQRDIAEPFISKLIELAEQLRLGDPLDDQVYIGPMITEQEARRVEEWTNEAVADGARVLTGGRRDGPFYAPTLLTDTKPSMKVNCQEVFGPVATVIVYDEFQDALDQVNDSRYGLHASLFSRNVVNIFKAYEQLEVGGLIVNDTTAFRADHMPFGGVKDSGMGREGPRYAIEEMTEQKALVLDFG